MLYLFLSNFAAKCFESKTKDGRDYRGRKINYSTSGTTCQKWSSTYPHKHSLMSGGRAAYVKKGLGYHNYCRNPSGRRARPWCYVTKVEPTWEYCDIKICK